MNFIKKKNESERVVKISIKKLRRADKKNKQTINKVQYCHPGFNKRIIRDTVRMIIETTEKMHTTEVMNIYIYIYIYIMSCCSYGFP